MFNASRYTSVAFSDLLPSIAINMACVNHAIPILESTKHTQPQQRRQQIYHIYFLLNWKLPPELVSPILNGADLYDHRVSISSQYCVIRNTNSPKVLLQTRQIASATRTRCPIRKITLSITSKDQGYVAYPGHGSWTWFTFGIFRAGSTIIQDEYELFRNVTSIDGFTTREITWSSDSSDDEERSRVCSLQNGDAIVIMGHAGFRGWTNFVREVKVTTSSAVIVR